MTFDECKAMVYAFSVLKKHFRPLRDALFFGNKIPIKRAIFSHVHTLGRINLRRSNVEAGKAGQKMQSLGCALTLLITMPIALTIFLGPLGLVIGIIVATLGIAGM